MHVYFSYNDGFEIEDIEIGKDAFCFEGKMLDPETDKFLPVNIKRWDDATETWEPVDALPDGWEAVVDEALSNAAEEAWERYYERFHG